jgi:hypothetical protein
MTDPPPGLARGLTNPANCSASSVRRPIRERSVVTLDSPDFVSTPRSGASGRFGALGRVAEAMGHQLIEAQPV